MRISRVIFSAALAAAMGFAVAGPASAATTAARPHSPGPGWTQVTLRAYVGGGCAQPENQLVNGSLIINDPCNQNEFVWFWRSLGSGKNEFVNYAGTEALSYSDSAFKLMPPNDATTYLYGTPDLGIQSGGGNYLCYSNAASTAYMVESAAGQRLNVQAGCPGATGGWWVDVIQ